MAHRKTSKKGSFGSHFDELVEHFDRPENQSVAGQDGSRRSEDNVHDKLFERAWKDERGRS